MSTSFTPIETETVSDKVIEQILNLIQSGELKVGDRLPGERQLAEELQVSRVPIREAFSKLEALGIIEVRRGVGAIVTRDLSGALASEIWMRWLSDHQSDIVQVYEVREAIECQATRLAAEPATEKHLMDLQELVRQMETAAAHKDYKAVADADRRFHEYIASMCGNDLLQQFLKAVNEISSLYRGATFRLPGRAQQSIDEHKKIITAIASGDRTVAGQAAAEHTGNIIRIVKHMQSQELVISG
jgi:GntR family transcriptional repressor for pyruvate dehydrogenase complex